VREVSVDPTRDPSPGPAARPRRRWLLTTPLAREIAWILAVKTAFLALLWLAFFSPADRPEVDPDRVDQALLAPATPYPARTEDRPPW
jgi:hypothetical protein